MSMEKLPFFVKLFSSCFTTEEDLFRRRSACTLQSHSESCSSFTDSFTDNSISCSEEECDSSRAQKGSTIGTSRRHFREMDTRSNRRKRLREDTMHLNNTLSATDQEANYFAYLTESDGDEPQSKRHHVDLSDYFSYEKRDMQNSGDLVPHAGHEKAKTLVSAKTKATLALLRRELNYVKSELNIVQGRCELLQDENRWLRANMEAEENILLQEVQMLLANKSQLALDNAYLTRERERLLQLVEYHKMGLPSDSD